MKKISLGILCITSLLLGQSEISLSAGKKDYENSKTKVDGKNLNLKVSHKFSSSKLTLAYMKDDVDRQHPVNKQKIDTLHVKKYNLLYAHNINKKASINASFIKIIDNLAPTDQGKIYGLGLTYKIAKGFDTNVSLYKSDYKKFDVNQYDLSFFKSFKLGETKGKVTLIGKSIHLDGDKYGNYTFKDKKYFTTGLKVGLNHKGYVLGMGTFLGDKAFTVLNQGQVVQHHAMQFDKTYMLNIGKKFKNFDVLVKYTLHKGKELPENQDNVDTKVVSLAFNYKF